MPVERVRPTAPQLLDEEDWIGTSEQMIERIRPRAIHERAILGAAIILVLGLNLAAHQLRPKPARYEFMALGSYVVVADTRAGQVALCHATVQAVLCTEEDSPAAATVRRLNAEWGWDDLTGDHLDR